MNHRRYYLIVGGWECGRVGGGVGGRGGGTSSTWVGVSVCYASPDCHSPNLPHSNNTACAVKYVSILYAVKNILEVKLQIFSSDPLSFFFKEIRIKQKSSNQSMTASNKQTNLDK